MGETKVEHKTGLTAVSDIVKQVSELDIHNDLKENIDILCGYVWPTAPQKLSLTEKIKNYGRQKTWMEYTYLRSKYQKHISLPRRTVQQVDVMVTLLPYRETYKELLYPIVKILNQTNVPVGVFTPSKESDLEIPTDVRCVISQHDMITSEVYKQARDCFDNLKTDINTISTELSLNKVLSSITTDFFRRMIWDKMVFSEILRRITPKVVFGLHFVSKPGYLAAIQDMEPLNRPKLVLMQHGSLFNQRYLDFKGSDQVILWGNYFKNYLPNHPHLPKPAIKVIGHPNLNTLLKSANLCQTNKSTRVPTIVFMAENDEPASKKRTSQAREIFVSTIGQVQSYIGIYKSHPSPIGIANSKALFALGKLGKCRLDTKSMPAEILPKADLIVGTSSTILLEAMALGIPVIQLLPEEMSSFWKNINLVNASTVNELIKLIDKLTFDVNYRKSVLEKQNGLVVDLWGNYQHASDLIAKEISRNITES